MAWIVWGMLTPISSPELDELQENKWPSLEKTIGRVTT